MVVVNTLKYRFLHFWPRPVWLLCLCICLQLQQASAQELVPLEVSQSKAVHLIFPVKVMYCDAGSKEVKVAVTNNIVKLLATKAGFAETNLTVITDDNYLYSYLLLYSKNPRRLTLQPQPHNGKALRAAGKAVAATAVGSDISQTTSATVQKHDATGQKSGPLSIPDAPAGAGGQEVHARFSEKIIKAWTHTSHHDNKQQLELQLRNIYVQGNFLYFTLMLQNSSPKEVLIDFVNFQQANRQGVLQRLYREALKKPFYIHQKKDRIPANGHQLMVYAFEKFSIDEGKLLLIEVGEKDGNRFLSIPLNAELINRATVHQ